MQHTQRHCAILCATLTRHTWTCRHHESHWYTVLGLANCIAHRKHGLERAQEPSGQPVAIRSESRRTEGAKWYVTSVGDARAMLTVHAAVMNYTEMEAKVREATNNEPWGASSSLMQEIANGTFN